MKSVWNVYECCLEFVFFAVLPCFCQVFALCLKHELLPLQFACGFHTMSYGKVQQKFQVHCVVIFCSSQNLHFHLKCSLFSIFPFGFFFLFYLLNFNFYFRVQIVINNFLEIHFIFALKQKTCWSTLHSAAMLVGTTSSIARILSTNLFYGFTALWLCRWSAVSYQGGCSCCWFEFSCFAFLFFGQQTHIWVSCFWHSIFL